MVRRKRKRWTRPRNMQHVNSWQADLTISMVESQNSINSGTWKRIDFTEDQGSSASCILAHIVNKSMMEPCPVGPNDNTPASINKVRVQRKIRPRVQLQNGCFGRFGLKVLEGLKKTIFSTSRMCKAGHDVHHTVFSPGLLTRGPRRNTESTSEVQCT